MLGALLLLMGLGAGAAPLESGFVTASSVYAEGYLPEFALDGAMGTRWASMPKRGEPEWWQVDLGVVTKIEQVIVHWETSYALQYEIQVSANGHRWQTVARKPDGLGGREAFANLGAWGRFVRVLCQKPGPYGIFSIWEVEFPEKHLGPILTEQRHAVAQKREQRVRESLVQLRQTGLRELIFAARPVVGEHWYANFGYYAAQVGKSYFDTAKLYRDGARLYRFDLESGRLTTLFSTTRGGLRDPQIHYDAGKLVFAYRPDGGEHYHLYELNIDGTGLRQLTDGPFDDIEPAYLPDGGIVFVSSRAKRWVNCWTTQVAVLHRCDADGGNIRELSSNNEHDNTPWPLPDGRILYTRWEYVDRSQVDYHHLWTANPDGTGQTIFFGNLHPGTVMIDAKPIPGGDKIVASFSPGHGQTEHAGAVAIVDPRGGPDATALTRVLTASSDFRDPWPLSEDAFLAATGNSVVLINGRGDSLELVKLPAADAQAGLLAHEPRPLLPRPRERILASRGSSASSTGRFLVDNVYEGRNMVGVKVGEIKKLLVLETLPKPINFTGGMEPLSYGGTFTLERILGTVPVESDGSAYFEAPALRSIFFVALDEHEMSVKRMQSFTSVMPGETIGCVGCHEERVKTPPASARSAPLALARGPSRIKPVTDVPEILDFTRDIQPVLDRHCLKCHDCDQGQGGVVLSGDRGPHYSLSYFALTARTQVADGRNRARSNYPPRTLGSSGSRLLDKLERSHYDVQVSPLEKKWVRLWTDTGAPYPGTYAALGCGMIGGYEQNTLDQSAASWATSKMAAEAIKRRCATCHFGSTTLPLTVCDEIVAPPWEDMSPQDPRRRFSRHLLYNLTRPEKSWLLLAPLARSAGGLGLCRLNPKDTNSLANVFKDTSDADYALILAAVREAKARLDTIKRFDMPGFRPRPEYVREMKRFGVLPASFDANAEPPDVYQLEKKYWESMWCRPPAVAEE